MQTRVYVTNLSATASLTSVRQRFADCGEVVDVQFVPERDRFRAPTAAYVTMGTLAAAEEAVRTLHGTLLDGRALMVSVAQGEESRSYGSRKAKPEVARAIIAQQYRERNNMTYELDCSGVRLTLRIFFPLDAAKPEWRVEARTNDATAAAIERAATTKALALQAIAEAWQASPTEQALPDLSWSDVTAAMKSVRAV